MEGADMTDGSAPGGCSITGCPKPGPFTRGFCTMHYRRFMRHGDPLHVTAPSDRRKPERTTEPCPIDGCDRNKMRAQEWCSVHYRRWQRHGDPTMVVKFAARDGQKRCPSCETWLPLDDFHRASRGPTGRQSTCKACQHEVHLRWQRENHERMNAYSRAWYQANHDAELERHRQRRLENPEAQRVASRRYREKNPDRAMESGRAWRRRNPGKVTGYASARRARRRSTTVAPIDHHAVFERDSWMCQLCGGPIDPALAWPDRQSASLDHRVPLANGGTHTLDNVQTSHLVCNMRKGARPSP
jgi:hypothetical protein